MHAVIMLEVGELEVGTLMPPSSARLSLRGVRGRVELLPKKYMSVTIYRWQAMA